MNVGPNRSPDICQEEFHVGQAGINAALKWVQLVWLIGAAPLFPLLAVELALIVPKLAVALGKVRC